MRQYLLIILTLLILSSCETKISQPERFQVILPDTTKTHSPNKKFDYLKGLTNQMNLPKLDTGVNGIKIRLWITSMITPHCLVTLNITDTSVTAQKFDYYLNADGRINYKPSERGMGGDSLQLLVEEINNIDFKKIISQKEIENFEDNMADGVNYDLEISNSKFYKLISYHCPEHFAKTEPNNKKFLDIIFMLDRHLHFYSPICAF
jgi:hypothetical protein